MLNIMIYDVMAQHILNKEVRKRMSSYSMEQTMELRRARWLARWLEKISHMSAERGLQKYYWHGRQTNVHVEGHSKQSVTDLQH
jgi:hypothetical protein